MKNDPFFSVVVPTFNRVEKLLPTLRSVLDQSLSDFELIVVDDGSTDGTPDIVKQQINDQRVRVISQKNSERGAARNNGFKNSQGKYVVFFDSDDLMHEDHLETLARHIQSENEPVFLATKFDFVDDEGKHKPSDMNALKQGYYDYRLFLNGNPLACNVCVKRNSKGIVPFEEDRKYSIKEDWLYMISNLKAHKLFIAGETTISMLDHDERSMRSDNKIIIERTQLAMKWIIDRMGLTNDEIRRLMAHVSYFCAIHSYLDHNRKDSLGFIINAFRFGGLRMKYIVLLVKSILGRKAMKALR